MRSRLDLIATSYQRLTGRQLAAPADDLARALWTSPRVIVAHGKEPDPIFFFGNRAALDQFEMSFEKFTAMPSRLSAEPMLREERQTLLDRVARNGFVDDIAGIRISATGRRFQIERGTVWNLIDERGSVHGQAATFDCRAELPTSPAV
ncbi:MAG: MEKHLA domain-containing protein [Sphingomonas bacterium]